MRIMLFELQKILRRKNLLVIMAVFLIANMVLLWYVDSLRQLPPAWVYREVQSQLEEMGEEQKGAFLRGKYEESVAYDLLLEITAINGMTELPAERRQEMIEMAVGENQAVVDRFSSGFSPDRGPAYTNSFEKEAAFWGGLYQQWQDVSNYAEQLAQIEQDAARLTSISIFNDGNTASFSSRNVLKTAEDYRRLQGLSVSYTITEGLSFSVRSPTTDVLAVCMAFFFTLLLITEEKQKGVFAILRMTRKGRAPLMAAKLAALAAVMFFSVAALYGGNFLYGALRYGFPPLSAPLQAVSGFINSTLAVSAGEFLLLYLLMKWLACFAFATIIVLITNHAKDAVTGFLGCALLYGAGLALTELIPPLSVWNTLRYINPVGIMDTSGILATYYNLNIAGRPFGLQSVVLVFMFCLAVVFAGLSVLCFAVKRGWDAGEFFLAPLLRRLKIRRHGFSDRITLHELHKLLLLGRAGVILVLFGIFAATVFPAAVPGLSIRQQQVQNYFQVLHGEITPEKLDFLEQEEALMQQAHEKTDWIMQQVELGELTPQVADELSAKYRAILNREEAFRYVQERVQYVRENPGTKLLFEDGYLQLMHLSSSDRVVIPTLAVLILCFSGFFAMEYQTGAVHILSTTPGGRRKTVKAKLLCMCMVATTVFIASALPVILSVGGTYGLQGWLYPLGSIPAFKGWPVPLGVYVLFHYLFQYLAILAVSSCILLLSNRLRKTTATVSICAACLLLPMILKAMHVPFAEYCSVAPLFGFATGMLSLAGQLHFSLLALLICAAVIGGLLGLSSSFGVWQSEPHRKRKGFQKMRAHGRAV